MEVDVTTLPTSAVRTWTDIGQYVRDLQYAGSGRSSELQRSSTGQLTALVSDRNDVISGLGLKKRQWIRVRSQWLGVTFAEWQGIIEAPVRKWPSMGFDSTMEIRAAGVFKVLKLYQLDGTTRPSERNDQRLAAWCAAANLGTGPFSTDTDTADAVVTPYGTGSDALSAATAIEESENGLLVETRDGNLSFQGRHYRYFNSGTSKATFGDQGPAQIPYRDDVEYEDDDGYVANYVSVTPLGGTAQVAQDTAAQAAQWFSGFSRSLVSSNAALALAAAQWILSLYKNPSPRIPQITVNLASVLRNPALVTTLLGTNVGDRFTWLRSDPIPIQKDVYIEQVSEHVRPGSWDLQFSLSPAIDQQAWLLGDATFGLLGQTTVLSY